MQGALDMGFSPEATQTLLANPPAMWVIGEADPVTEDAQAAQVIAQAEFVVVTAQFMTATAQAADMVLPVQSFAEREGTFTNAMRRVQRFYMAQTPLGDTLPGWRVFAHVGSSMPGGDRPRISSSLVMRDITQHVLRYADMSYTNLAEVEPQFPTVGGADVYYGGTAYANYGGLGVQWATNAEKEKYRLTVRRVDAGAKKPSGLVVVPIRLLYTRDVLFEPSERVMHAHIPAPYAELNGQDAAQMGIEDGDQIAVSAGDWEIEVMARVNGQAPVGVVLLPQRLCKSPTPAAPIACTVRKIEE
jgi:NADH-quinone oxidoreductase subunit G